MCQASILTFQVPIRWIPLKDSYPRQVPIRWIPLNRDRSVFRAHSSYFVPIAVQRRYDSRGATLALLLWTNGDAKPSSFGKFLENSGTIFRLHISPHLSNGGAQVWIRFDAINLRFWSFPVTHKTDIFVKSRTIPDSSFTGKILVFWWVFLTIINSETFVAMWSSYSESTCLIEPAIFYDFDILWSL